MRNFHHHDDTTHPHHAHRPAHRQHDGELQAHAQRHHHHMASQAAGSHGSEGMPPDGMRGPRRHGGGGGRGGRGHGRLFAAGELPLVLLSLIAKRPCHGYELIKAIEETFQGTYSPSPGAIYPTLTLLEDQGYVQSSIEAQGGSRKLYTVTAEGNAHLDERRDEVNGALARMEMSARAVAGRMPPEAVMQAMHTLKHALAFHSAWPEQEIQRVTALLQSTADEIARLTPAQNSQEGAAHD
ncbi:MAG: PadR family transcriptional regulator [Janthinobacterium lividum]